MKGHYPDSRISLRSKTPFQLLVSVILSAQCTDARVNQVTPRLFRKYPTARAMADADPEHVEELIRSTGFYRNKTKSIIGAARAIVAQHNGKVPTTMDELVALPGVARKTANVVLYNAHGVIDGIAVDTHVQRIANLLRLTSRKDPKKIERDLMKVVDQDVWGDFTHLVIDHGRAICIARRPKCESCFLNDVCPSSRA